MTLPFFLADALGRVGDSVVLDGEEGRHAVVVRRTKPGEQIALTDGAGGTATCEVLETTKSTLTARVLGLSAEPRPEPRLTVVQAIPKGDRGELAVEVLTEVGVDRIVPWAASRCVAVWRSERAAKSLGRWRSTAREAAKQSRRSWLPQVTEMASTEEVRALLDAADLGVVLHESATTPLAGLPVPTTGSIVVVVGPEGGLTDEEVAAFSGTGPAHAVRLGSSVLRTSTAGVCAASALLARTPRWA